MSEPEKKNRRSRLPDWLVAVVLVEATALLIALVTPITPSKTGSQWTPADIFSADPSYLEKVLASFVVVNVMIAIIGVLAWIFIRRDRSK